MALERFCRKEPVTVAAGEPVVEAARRMLDRHVGAVVVLEEGRPVGILTDRDIVLRVVAAGRDGATAVREVMSGDLVLVRIDDGIDDVVRHMREGQVRRLPIVRPDGCLAGMVTLDDLVVLFGAELSGMASAVSGNRGP